MWGRRARECGGGRPDSKSGSSDADGMGRENPSIALRLFARSLVGYRLTGNPATLPLELELGLWEASCSPNKPGSTPASCFSLPEASCVVITSPGM